MLNILVILNERSHWEPIIGNIVNCGINVDVFSGQQEPSVIIGSIASQSIDGVLYFASEEDYNDSRLNILFEIRRLNPEIPIVISSIQYHIGIQKAALECEAEWYLANTADSSLMKLLLQRIDKKTQALKHRKEDRLRSILIDYIKDERRVSYQDKVSLFQNYQKAAHYQAFIVKILPPYRKRALVENDNLAVLKGYELLNEYLIGFSKTNIYEYGHDLLVVAAGEMSELRQIKERLIDFLNEMKRFSYAISSVATWVYVGLIVKDIKNISVSYKSAYEIRDDRLLMPGSGVIVARERVVAFEPHEDGHIQVFDVRKTLSNALATFDDQLVHKSLAQLKSNLISSAEINGKEIFSIYRTLLSSLIRELEWKEIDLSKKGIDYDGMIKEFEYFWDVDDVFKALENLYVTSVAELKIREEQDAPTQIVLAKRYIRSYFNMPLSLSELSAYVGMNENYFSEYFKKQTGINFKEYQTDLRIRHAKQMLLDKQYSMDDISDAVGYNDTKYFSRVFKQETGMAPSEYRKKYHVIND